MQSLNKTKMVMFSHPFTLEGLDEILPAGAYRVDMEDELIEGLSFPVYRRIETCIHLHAPRGKAGIKRMMTIDPRHLEAALIRDKALNASCDGLEDTALESSVFVLAPLSADDRQAIERGETEGMIKH